MTKAVKNKKQKQTEAEAKAEIKSLDKLLKSNSMRLKIPANSLELWEP